MDKRLALLELAVRGITETLINRKLLGEYERQIKNVAIRNETIRMFIEYVVDRGTDSGRSALSSRDWEKARAARWPAHDQHLLAAAIIRPRTTIYVTEGAHQRCTDSIQKQFGIRIVAS